MRRYGPNEPFGPWYVISEQPSQVQTEG